MNTNPVFFYNAKSESEALVIVSKLKAHGIEAFVKRDDAGAVSKLYTGQSVTGADIYVPYDALFDANNILSINESDIEPFGDEKAPKDYFEKGFIKKLVLSVAGIAVLIAALYFVLK